MTVTYQIHPSIGIARVGNSPDYFLGPEYGDAGFPPASFRDKEGHLRRQAARFRVFRVETLPGSMPKAYEINSKEARVVWTVTLANRKGVGRRLEDERVPKSHRNDAEKKLPPEIDQFIIGPDSAEVSGISQPPQHPNHPILLGGKFKGEPVTLGEIRTDDQGRLLVLGGSGTSGFVPTDLGGKSPKKPKAAPRIENFADNDDWYDDTSDGTVFATIYFGKDKVEHATPAWVIVAPPDFAPEIQNLITLYDQAFQVAIKKGLREAPKTPDFERDIKPILQRALGYRWVNRHVAARHGVGHPYDFDLGFWKKLGDPNQEVGLRDRLFSRLRDPNSVAEESSSTDMPRLHDDAYSFAKYDYKRVLPLLPFQYLMMKKWRDGDFTNGKTPARPESLTDTIDRCSMQACVGGAFYPGMETWDIVRDEHIWAGNESDPFRLNVSNKGITTAEKLVPGKLTEGNALPWQADFLDCAWEDGAGWWPAQRPDHVRIAPDSSEMFDWAGGIAEPPRRPVAEDMIKHWHQLGFVVKKVDSQGNDVFVEDERDPNRQLHPRQAPGDD